VAARQSSGKRAVLLALLEVLVQILIRDGVLELREYAPGQAGHDAVDVYDGPVEVQLLFELQLPVL